MLGIVLIQQSYCYHPNNTAQCLHTAVADSIPSYLHDHTSGDIEHLYLSLTVTCLHWQSWKQNPQSLSL